MKKNYFDMKIRITQCSKCPYFYGGCSSGHSDCVNICKHQLGNGEYFGDMLLPSAHDDNSPYKTIYQLCPMLEEQEQGKEQRIQLTAEEADKIHKDFCEAVVAQSKKYNLIEKAIYETYKQGLIDQEEYLNLSHWLSDKMFQKVKAGFYMKIPVHYKLKQ